ncbi:MAG: tetratricopeptide repeat protein [Sterolibacterium sp.]|jgi:tetratricopeptide (TPR) repeat protein
MQIDLTTITNPDIRNFLSYSANPESLAKGYFLLGVEAEGKSNWAGAIEYYKVVLNINPADPVSRYFASHNIAYSMIQLGRMNESKGYAQAAITVNEEWPHAYNLLGIACRALGKYEDAARAFLSATLKGPKGKTAWLQLQSLLAEHPELHTEVPDLSNAVESARRFLVSRGVLPRSN